MKETLEEARKIISKDFSNISFKEGVYHGVLEGANWQKERMYSEEEIYEILLKHTEYFAGFGERTSLTQWFSQFKK